MKSYITSSTTLHWILWQHVVIWWNNPSNTWCYLRFSTDFISIVSSSTWLDCRPHASCDCWYLASLRSGSWHQSSLTPFRVEASTAFIKQQNCQTDTIFFMVSKNWVCSTSASGSYVKEEGDRWNFSWLRIFQVLILV